MGPMDSSKFDSMPVTLSGMSSPTVSRKRRWWVFRPEYELGQIFDEALARLPNLDPLWTTHLELFLITVAAKFHNESLAFVPARWLLVENLLAENEGFKSFELFWDLLEYLLMCRTICEMNGSRLLVAPDFVETGDTVAILTDCSNPVILREGGSSGTFRLLGDAHALGVSADETRQDGLVNLILS